jgi:small subunit ribosomal protein S8
MTMTDPVADMLTRLRNANSAYHDSVTMPNSKIKVHIAEILQQEGYIAGWRVEDADVGKSLVIALKFGPTRERSIAGLKRISKPGLRVYARKDNLPRVLGGLGVAIISTSPTSGRGAWDVTNRTHARRHSRRRRCHHQRPRGHGERPEGEPQPRGRRAD